MQHAIILHGNYRARIERLYDSNCASLLQITQQNASTPQFDDCSAIDIGDICSRVFMSSVRPPRLLGLCATSTKFSEYTRLVLPSAQVCPRILNINCSDVAIFGYGRGSIDGVPEIDSLFCLSHDSKTNLLANLQSMCETIGLFDGCEGQKIAFGLVELSFSIATMALFAYLLVLYGLIDGENGNLAIKRDFVKEALRNKPHWVSQWKEQYILAQAAKGLAIDEQSVSETEVMKAAFDTFRQDNDIFMDGRPTSQSYQFPFTFKVCRHLIVKLIVLYFFLLFVNLIGLVAGARLSACPEPDSFTISMGLFFILFMSGLTCIIVNHVGCGNSSIARRQEHAFMYQLMSDKFVQRSLLPGCSRNVEDSNSELAGSLGRSGDESE
jgi:hypothetical protein